MRGIRSIFFALALVAAFSCGPRKASAPAAPTREFPAAAVPAMITEPQQRLEWLCQHFWDRFTQTDSLYSCDSVTVNGVKMEDLEKQMGLFTTLTESIPLPAGETAVQRLFSQVEAFQLAYPQGNVFPETVGLTTRYFYDPNSPVRSEDLYLPFVQALAGCPLIRDDYRQRYARDARLCSLNRTGTPAADFIFIDSFGKRRSLYGIGAERILLVFGNPDCPPCRDLQAQMESQSNIMEQIQSGRLKVVDIYIDQDIDLWKKHLADYPPQWINGYDPTFTIRQDLTYNIRAIPSLYLLDAKKTVLLKDATPQRMLEALL